MTIIKQMLSGEIEMSSFTSQLSTNIELQNYISNLVPDEAKFCPAHQLWKNIGYSALINYNFDLYRFLLAIAKFDGSIGDNLDIFGIIKAVYSFLHPECECTKKYHEAHILYLNVTKDSFEGPEVQHITEQIIYRALEYKTKKQRLQYCKAEMAIAFHVTDNHYPRWIQGPEWPMGINSPMVYVSKKRKGEEVYFIFKDYDTAEERVITQFY